MFIQTRRYSATRAREVMTRDMEGSSSYATDKKLPFPRLVAVRSVWEPDDSKHGGKLYLSGQLCGAPVYEDFGVGKSADKWRAHMEDVKKGLEQNFISSHIFNERRMAEWRTFLEAYPMGGLKDVPLSERPPFSIPSFPDRPSRMENEEVDKLVVNTGEDKAGKPRLYFKRGEDTLEYQRADSKATYSGYHLDGRAFGKKRAVQGESEFPHG